MKITKRQLRRIVKEEKQKISEYGGRFAPGDSWSGDAISQAERAIGSYFDTVLMGRVRKTVALLWTDAVDAAIEFDGLEVDEAEDAVAAGLTQLFNQALEKARQG
jgi:hypothetical protein